MSTKIWCQKERPFPGSFSLKLNEFLLQFHRRKTAAFLLKRTRSRNIVPWKVVPYNSARKNVRMRFVRIVNLFRSLPRGEKSVACLEFNYLTKTYSLIIIIFYFDFGLFLESGEGAIGRGVGYSLLGCRKVSSTAFLSWFAPCEMPGRGSCQGAWTVERNFERCVAS